MPNWITNEVTVTGEREAISKVAALISDEGKVNFNNALPTPEKYITHPNKIHMGHPNSNVWALENWGTKWNAQESGKIKAQAHSNTSGWAFTTAWSAPDLWFHALIDKVNEIPGLTGIDSISLTFADGSNMTGGRIWRDSAGAIERGDMLRREVVEFLGVDGQ